MPGLVAQAQGCAKPDDGTASRKATRWHQGCALRDGMHQLDHHTQKQSHLIFRKYHAPPTLRFLRRNSHASHSWSIPRKHASPDISNSSTATCLNIRNAAHSFNGQFDILRRKVRLLRCDVARYGRFNYHAANYTTNCAASF